MIVISLLILIIYNCYRLFPIMTKYYLVILTIILTSCDFINTDQKRADKVESYKLYKTNCGQPEIEFTTSWTNYPLGKLYLANDCPNDKSKKGNYWKGGFIEIWGLGDGWIIWIDSDAI